VIRFVVLASLAALVAAAAFALPGAGASACTAGVRTVGGATVRTFCGPAKATAKIGSKTFHFTGGTCAVEQGMFTVNIGSITLGAGKPKYAYFGLDAKPPKAGAHPNQIVSWQFAGQRYSLLPVKVVLDAGLHSGSFSGSVLTGGSGSGTFTCK
jgi:hypothetical protein